MLHKTRYQWTLFCCLLYNIDIYRTGFKIINALRVKNCVIIYSVYYMCNISSIIIIIRLHHIPMVKTIVFVIIIIRLHHYYGEDYCFCHYY